MSGILTRNGFNIVENENIADLIILNTCVVKDPTIKKIEQRIKIIVKQNKSLIISGCMPEVFSKKLSKIAPKSPLISTHHIKEILNAVRKLSESKPVYYLGNQQELKLGIPKLSRNKSISIVQISQGCINECSYCLVKKVKGNLFSYPEDKIIKEVENNLKAGAKEIWLTSQDNACYGFDQALSNDVSGSNKKGFSENCEGFHDVAKPITHENTYNSLPQLVNRITSLNHKFYLRIGMMNPSSIMPILDDLIESYKNPKVFKFLHLPIQSGSDKILKLMNRKYKIKDALYIINKFKKEFPEIVIATDIIVGFPNETSEDFKKTLQLIDIIRPDVLNHSRYWAMKGTKSAKINNNITKEELKEREVELMKLHAKIALENKQKLIGKEYKVLVDNKGFQDTWLARNENYQLIIIQTKENLQGKFLKVKIKEAKAHYMFANKN
jgi:MiaB/RimO family radical SAM methylthiotransferase